MDVNNLRRITANITLSQNADLQILSTGLKAATLLFLMINLQKNTEIILKTIPVLLRLAIFRIMKKSSATTLYSFKM